MSASVASFPVAQLFPHHAKLITDSAISEEVKAARGYRTVTTKAELKRLRFGEYQCLTPALLVPVWGVTGDIVTYQIRPDYPRQNKKGKTLKYETPADSQIRLDVPPLARQWLGDPEKPLFITEGARKADSAVSRGLCCIALLGVWNWRGSNDDGGKTALADWESIPLNERKVYIVFDSDLMEKKAVHQALARLKQFLESRGADVRIVYLPSGEGGAKIGMDDFFAAGHSVDDLFAHATSKLRLPEEPANENPAIPRGFKLTDTGVYAIQQNDEGDSEDVFVCSRLEVTAGTRSDESDTWGKMLEFNDPDGVAHRWLMPISSLAGDGTDVRARLMHEGLIIAPGRRVRDLLATYILTSSPNDRAVCVSRTGWHGEGSFVFPDTTINQPDGERILLQTSADFAHALRVSGTLDDWKSQISQYCPGNPLLAFSTSTGFAAALLKPLEIESGGFHFRSGSSKGKTTLLHVAASTSGGGREPYVETWRATANGIEAVCERHNDLLLPLDEIGQCDPAQAAEVAYLIANEQGKARMARSVTARRRITWRTLFLSSGEISLASHVAQIGRRTKAGQEVRLLDIPVGDHAFGVFDDLHEFKSGQEFADHLKTSARRFYGVPLRDFLEKLTADLPQVDLRAAFNTYLAKFFTLKTDDEGESLVPVGAGGEVKRAATRFALVAFAGEMATAYEITGWSEGEAEKAAVELFNLWLANRGTTGSADDAAMLRQVRAFIEAHGASRFETTETDRVVNRVGFLNRRGETTEYCFYPEAFQREVCAGYDFRAVARALNAQGCLVKGEGKNMPAKRTPPLEGRQTRVFVVL